MKEVIYTPIGVVHSPHREPRGTPIQPTVSRGVKGTVEVFSEYAEGLEHIDGFSHIILLYHFHRSKVFSLRVMPFLDNKLRGVFANRASRRPNSIGISVLRLLRVERNTSYVQNVDILDGTPLLDIKPYVSEFETVTAERFGWLEEKINKPHSTVDDGRFHNKTA